VATVVKRDDSARGVFASRILHLAITHAEAAGDARIVVRLIELSSLPLIGRLRKRVVALLRAIEE
jgi:hypothetical protein